jgi:hypothetical protein
MTKSLKSWLLSLSLTALLGALPAFGAPTLITVDVNPAVSFQQTTNNPCVIGDQSCKQPAGMGKAETPGYTNYSGTPLSNGSTYDAYSPTYSYAFLTGVLSAGGPLQTSFKIGIDDNVGTGQGVETLQELTVWECPAGNCTVFTKNQLDSFLATGDDAALIAAGYLELYKTGTTYPLAVHNGNGFSDALSSTISIAGLTNATFIFEAVNSNDSDGMEEFFLIPANATPAVPEPTAIVLLGTVLLACGIVVRRKRAA